MFDAPEDRTVLRVEVSVRCGDNATAPSAGAISQAMPVSAKISQGKDSAMFRPADST